MVRMRATLATLGVALLGAGAAGLLLEGVVLLAFGEQAKFPRHVVGAPFGVRINQPRASYRHKSADVNVRFRINGQGMRSDRDYAYAKPPGVKRIVSLGDSFTIGYEVDVRDAFSSVLEEELRARGYRVEVLNAGVSGHSTAEELVYLRRELFRYDPDLVLVSFFANDLVDNERSGLFRLEGDRLVETAAGYVPAGRLGDFLNRLGPMNALGESSNAFAFLKERLTLLAKRRMLEANLAHVHGAAARTRGASDPLARQRRLAAALLDEIYRETRARGIPLVIQSIPTRTPPGGAEPLVDAFPLAEFDVQRDGLAFFAAKSVLEPALGSVPLYHERSHGHWTPYSHRLAGQGLARLIVERGLLAPSRGQRDAGARPGASRAGAGARVSRARAGSALPRRGRRPGPPRACGRPSRERPRRRTRGARR